MPRKLVRKGRVYLRGKIWYVDYRDANGKRLREPSGPSYEKACAELRRKLGETVAEKYIYGGTDVPWLLAVRELLESKKNKAPETYYGYQNSIKRIEGYKTPEMLSEVNLDFVNGLKTYLLKSGYAVRSNNKVLVDLLSILHYAALKHKGYNAPYFGKDYRFKVPKEPFSKFHKIAAYREMMYYATDGEERGVLVLGGRLGLRRGEMINMLKTELCFETLTARVRRHKDMGAGIEDWSPKNGKERNVPFTKEEVPFLQALVKANAQSEYLLVPSPPKRKELKQRACYNKNSFNSRYQRIIANINKRRAADYKARGLSEPAPFVSWPHKLRHTAATAIKIGTPESGRGDLQDISAFLGHTSLATTMIYTHIEDEQVRETVNLHLPSLFGGKGLCPAPK